MTRVTYEACLFVKSWAWWELKSQTRLGVKVYTDVALLLDGRYAVTLDHLIAMKNWPEYKPGNGLKALRELCLKADEVHVPITLVCGDPLVGYYEAVGFKNMAATAPLFRAMLREPLR